MNRIKLCLLICFVIVFFLPQPAFAMHIMEGFLPLKWCIIWGVISFPFIGYGLYTIGKITKNNPKLKMLIALAGAFAFVLSALKIPSVTGSCSHPTGVGLGAILFGPAVMTVLSSIILLFQALLLAHGGITTLGANVFSMGIVGTVTAYFIYKFLKKIKSPQWLCIFMSATLGNLLTYVSTSLQLALAHSGGSGFVVAFLKFLGVFALTQIPLAISEGLITVLIFNFLSAYNLEELKELKVISEES